MPPLCSQDKEQTPDDLRSFIFPGLCQPLSLAILCSGHMNLLYAPGKCNLSYLEAFTQVESPFFPDLIYLVNNFSNFFGKNISYPPD